MKVIMGRRLNCTLFFLGIIFTLFGCSNKNNNMTHSNQVVTTDSIGSALYRQLISGYQVKGDFGDYLNYSINKEDFDITEQIIDSLLNKKNYKKSSFNEFKERIKMVFNIDIKPNEIKHLDFYDICTPPNNPYSVEESLIFHLDARYMIISTSIAIPEIIDYQKEYPDIAAVEDTINKETVDGATLIRWKDLMITEQGRKATLNWIYHYNMYIFHDNKSSLTWLLNNDKSFLNYLLRGFGYDREPQINQMVLADSYIDTERQEEDIHYDYSDCEGILYSRDCNGNLRINHGVLATIKDMTTADDSKYLVMIYNYLKKIEAGTLMTDLSDDEKIEIYCYFGRIEVDLNKKYQKNFKWNKPYAGISSLLTGHNYQEIARKHKYWGIPNFEEIEQVVEWEEPIVNDGDMSIPSFDYSILRSE